MIANICTARWAGWGVNGRHFWKVQHLFVSRSVSPQDYDLWYHNPSKVMGPRSWQSLIDAGSPSMRSSSWLTLTEWLTERLTEWQKRSDWRSSSQRFWLTQRLGEDQGMLFENIQFPSKITRTITIIVLLYTVWTVKACPLTRFEEKLQCRLHCG